MGNTLVKNLGIGWTVIGLGLMVTGLAAHTLEDRNTVLYDHSGLMYSAGWAILVLAITVYIVGWLLKPSISEILDAERLVERNQDRLQAYREGIDPEQTDAPYLLSNTRLKRI